MREIEKLDKKKFPYFVWKNTSLDNGVECWFQQVDAYGNVFPRSISEETDYLTNFMILNEDKCSVRVISNTQFFSEFVIYLDYVQQK